jgi:SAM-dependent methyltransferase
MVEDRSLTESNGNIRPCPMCHSTDRDLLVVSLADVLDENYPLSPVEYPYYRCKACGSSYMAQLPSPSVLAAYYESPVYLQRVLDVAEGPNTRISWLWWLYYRITRPIPVKQPGRHLDFGCGPGQYLLFTKACGWDCVGVEYSDASAALARSRGLNVVLEQHLAEMPDYSFDLITLNHSLEHVADPGATLVALGRKLRPGGTLFIEVPSISPLEFLVFGRYYLLGAPLHFQVFSDESIQLLAEKAGLRLMRCMNNPWMLQYFTGSLLSFLRWKCGLRLNRKTVGLIYLTAFPLVAIPAFTLPLVGCRGVARRYIVTR